MTDMSASPGLDALRAVPIFSGLDDAALSRIAECATEFEVAAGHVLAEANMAGSGLVIVQDGGVVVDLPGRPVELGAGEFFGEMSLLTSHPRVARVRAAKPTRCLAIGRQDFDRLLESEPKLALAMLRVVAQRLAQAEGH